MSKAAREFIAIGPNARFPWTNASWVPGREGCGAPGGLQTPDTSGIRIDHHDFKVPVVFNVIATADGTTAHTYKLEYRALMSSDGIDGATGGWINPMWGPLVTVKNGLATGVAVTYEVTMGPTQAICVYFTNSGAAMTAEAPSGAKKYGQGVSVRIGIRS